MPLWLTGGSLAHSDTLADEGDFQKQPSGERCLCCAPNRRLTNRVCYGSIHPVAALWKPHSATLMDAISIFHGRGAPILTGPRVCAVCALHYSLPSLVAGLICVDKGLDGRMWFNLLRFNYFYPRFGLCGAGMTSLLHFHVESFIQGRVGGWPPLKSVPSPHTSIAHPCWLPLGQILYWGRPSAFTEECAFGDIFPPLSHLNALFVPQVLQIDHTVRNICSLLHWELPCKMPLGMI